MQDALTPMMQQYQRLRKSIPADTLLLFRLGDFYELFFEDAKEASALLNVALTKRNSVPMCGVPYHAAKGYIAKLIKAGRRVAVCDQSSEPQPGRIVTRDITQIISAGTVSDLDLLESKRANYLGGVYIDNNVFGFAYADLTTDKSRIGRIPQCAGHQFAGGSRSNGHTDGGAQIASLDFATAARSHPTRTPATDDCRSFAGTGRARVDPKRVKIDPRH